MTNDTAFKRRKGRFGWSVDLRDGDAYVTSIKERSMSYGEYISAPFESLTPVEGGSLFATTSPNVEYFDSLLSNVNSVVTRDSARSTSGRSYKIENKAGVSVPTGSNIFLINNFDNSEINFDIFFTSDIALNTSLKIYLIEDTTGFKHRFVLPVLFPNQWQTV